MQTESLETSSGAWRDEVLALDHDVYHLPEYQEFAARWHFAGSPRLFVVRDGDHRLLLPLIIRDLPTDLQTGDGRHDAISSRFFPGPLVTTGPDGPDVGFTDAAMPVLLEALAKEGVASAFVRLHPLLMAPMASLEQVGAVVDNGEAVAIDLSLDGEALWQQTRHNHRRDINKARRNGYTMRLDERWAWLDRFATMYAETMDRVDAAAAWRLPPGYFHDLRASLGEHVHLAVVEREGQLAAASILTEASGIVEYHLTATADAHRAFRPSKLLIHEASLWAKRRGNLYLSLAGSLQRGDPLNHFKLGFSPIGKPMYTWRLIPDRDVYETLVRARQAQAGEGSETDADWFPAYRRPIHAGGPADG